MYKLNSASAHPLDAAARAYALLGRITELDNAQPLNGSPRECVRALEEHERQLQELSALLHELDDLRNALAEAEPSSQTDAARAALEAVLVPVEFAAVGVLARAEDLAARRRALSALLDTPANV